MALPPGRKPLTDQDMISLLRRLAGDHQGTKTESELQETADRFVELTNTGVEHLDPDKRSWYYDGDGTRRPKSQQDE